MQFKYILKLEASAQELPAFKAATQVSFNPIRPVGGGAILPP